MEKFENAISGRALMALGNTAFSCDVGKITSYDPVNHLVIVEIHPATDNDPASLTGWIPYASSWVGNGWGMYAAPVLDTLCIVVYQQGSRQIPLAAQPLFDGSNRPLTVQSGEFWLVHKSGSSLKFTNDGQVLVSSTVQIDLTAPVVNINASNECNISTSNMKIDSSAQCDIFSPVIKAGSSSGAFETLLKSDNTPTTNLQGS